MKTFKHCDRPGLNCRQLVMSDDFIKAHPLKAIEMYKIFNNKYAYNSCARGVYYEESKK